MKLRKLKVVAAACGLVAFSPVLANASTVTVPTITFPVGFDVAGLLNTTVQQNGTLILGGVAVVAFLYIIGKIAGGLRRGSGSVAKGGH